MISRSDQSLLRPTISKAWAKHCLDHDLLSTDRVAMDTWYRDQLFACCRVRSSTSLSPETFRSALDWFKSLAGDPIIRGFTQAQNGVLAQVATKAFPFACKDPSVTFQEWFSSECSRLGLVDCHAMNATTQFDRVMSHFAILANDDYWLSRCLPETRVLWQIDQHLDQLTNLTGQIHTREYAAAISRQAGSDVSLSDAPESTLRLVLSALKRQVRRVTSDTLSRVPF